PAAGGRVIVGLGDDAAVLRAAASDSARRLNLAHLVLTTDLMIETVHFSRRYMSLSDIGYKALAVSLSDLAAMGAKPTFALGSLGLPPGTTGSEVDQLLRGVQEAVKLGGVQLIGGDTVAAPQWTIGFTALGEVKGKPLLRSGARPGDTVWHGGGLGLSQVGLHRLWQGEKCSGPERDAHARPVPQLELGSFLASEGLASACLDTSDSLSQCLLQLAGASGVGLAINLAKSMPGNVVAGFIRQRRRKRKAGTTAFTVPARMNPGGRALKFRSTAEFILSCAEDYGLLFTAPPKAAARLIRESPVALAHLGTVVDISEGCYYRAEDGKTYELSASGYQHLGM
ncbi:thiamine-phosphate kinase, partial [bacterium]|nr:thiamine-phosphate kinase [bacterium]